MARIGYHASHEQFPPQELLALAMQAERAGFHAAMCSDHLHPWSRAQGESGHAWVWLGAAMARMSLPFGVVNAPVGRYHPVEIAQAAATLACLFPERFWLAVGSGEALNECATGTPWPDKAERNARLREAVDIIRALWRGDQVRHEGRFVVRDARLYSRPAQPPRIFLAALTAGTARWGGGWADGLITLAAPGAPVREVVDAFRGAGGAGKPVHLQVKLSYAPDEEDARRGAYEQWRTNALSSRQSENLRTPEDFEREAQAVDMEDVARAVHISADPERHVHWLREYLQLDVAALHLHNVNRGQRRFIADFARHVIPALE